jgi:hypothetical protein
MRDCATDAPTCASDCVRACACGCGRAPIRAATCERLPVGVYRGWIGAQAFGSASAFNATIGAWNTASVTTLYYVCAAFGPAARHRGGRAQSVLDAVRPSWAAAPPMRAALVCNHTYRHVAASCYRHGQPYIQLRGSLHIVAHYLYL